jgi:S1-C subfamily serine protease
MKTLSKLMPQLIPGNSGGALLDAKGRLIGINTAIISQTRSSIGIGLAIPINMARKVLTDLVEGGELRRGISGS